MEQLNWLGELKQKTLAGEALGREEILRMLAIDANSTAVDCLGEAAREVAEQVTGNQARIWTAVGVDYMPCPINCDFCSFGEKWKIIKEPYAWQEEEIVAMARRFLRSGAKWVTLRTTEYFPPDAIVALAQKIRKDLVGDYGIVVNTGEFTPEIAAKFKQSGINIVYHSLRLREGEQTGIAPAYRKKTLASVQKSPLDLAFLIEPIGPEHTNEELADVFLTSMEYGTKLSGAMARVPVPGTPLGAIAPLAERRLAQIVAVSRLAAGWRAPDICVHPPTKLAMQWGANVCVVESGAIPRDAFNGEEEWNVFKVEDAISWFEETGYEIDRGLRM